MQAGTRRFRWPWVVLVSVSELFSVMHAKDLSKDLVNAAKAKDLLKVESLLKNGADPNSRGEATEFETGRPVLFATSETGIIRLLIEHGGNVNIQTKCIPPSERWLRTHAKGSQTGCKDGLTALYLAVGRRNLELIEMLLAAGADPALKTDGDDPLSLARRTAFPAAVVALTRSQARGIPLISAVRLGNVTEVRSLLTKGVDVNAKDSQGATALLYAAALEGGAGLVQLLLAAGADPNTRTPAGRSIQFDRVVGGAVFSFAEGGTTPLMLAASHGDIDAVRALIQRGAEVSATDDQGNTACKSLPAPPDPSSQEVDRIENELRRAKGLPPKRPAGPTVNLNSLNAVRGLVCR